jgi:CDGSH-type Zn-finger protein
MSHGTHQKTQHRKQKIWAMEPTKNTTQKTKDMSHGTHQKTQHRKQKIWAMEPTKKHNTEN